MHHLFFSGNGWTKNQKIGAAVGAAAVGTAIVGGIIGGINSRTKKKKIIDEVKKDAEEIIDSIGTGDDPYERERKRKKKEMDDWLKDNQRGGGRRRRYAVKRKTIRRRKQKTSVCVRSFLMGYNKAMQNRKRKRPTIKRKRVNRSRRRR